MKKLILLLLLPFAIKGQDTIFKKDNTLIYCKITKVTSSMVFYTENKIGKSISITDVNRYTSNKTNESIKENEVESTKCDIKLKYDKFENDSTYTLDFADWLRVLKVKKSGKVVYFMRLSNEGFSPQYGKTGVTILLSDGSKIEKPNQKIDCTFRAGSVYDFSAFFVLNENDLQLLSKHRMTDWRLYIYDRGLGEKRGEKLREQILCLIKS